ncbi:SH3 domain-containing protein [Bartonella sp. B41]
MFKRNLLSATMILFSFVGIGIGISESAVLAGTVAHIALGNAILRAGPDKTYGVITIVPTGAKVQINGCLSDKDWCSLRYSGRDGWVSARYLNVDNVPTISVELGNMKKNPVMKTRKRRIDQVASDFKMITVPKKKLQRMQQQRRIDIILDSTGVKKRDERTILNPSPNAHSISVKHVTAYNPLFPENVNFRNTERNETRYRVITYPSP